MKWPDLAAKSRRAAAEALTTITLTLTEGNRKFPDRTSADGRQTIKENWPLTWADDRMA